jgi:hypothetical protein
VSGGNSITASFDVSFFVRSYSISLDPTGTHTFPAAVYGYGVQTAKTVTIENTGNQPTGALTVALSGTNYNSFTVSPSTPVSSINANDSDNFTVVPKTGLGAGTYTATVTVSNSGNGITAGLNVSFTVSPQSVTAASVTGLVKPAAGAAPVTAASLSGGTGYTVQSIEWSPQVSGTFAAATSYTAAIVLQTGANYQFSGSITPTVNAGNSSAGTITGSGAGNTLSFDVDFPVTAGTAGITITAWVNIDNTLITDHPGNVVISKAAGDTLTVQAAAGLTDIQWSMDGTDYPAPRGTAQSFSLRAVDYPAGTYILGLRLKKNGVPYSTELQFTVTN